MENSIQTTSYTGKIPGRVKYTFAFGALGKDLIYGMIATYAMIYFTDILKVNPIFIGAMFFVAKMWDAFNDLFMGMIVDNTHSKWGKFIPWLAIGTVVNAIVFVVLFTDYHLSGVGLCIFATAAYIMWGMTYTIMDIPYWSIIPNLSSDPKERDTVSVLPRIFASIGQSLIIAGFGAQILKALSGGEINQTGYHRFAIIIAVVFVLTIGITVINLPKNTGNNAPEEKVKFSDIFKIIRQNDQLRWAVAFIFLYNIGVQFIMGVATYYFTYVTGNLELMTSFMVSASVAEVVGLIVFPKVAQKLSRKTSFLLACLLPAVGLIMLFAVGFMDIPNPVVLTVLLCISGVIVKLGTGLELGTATVALADVVDYGECKVGTRNEGVVFSLQTLIVKFTAALTAMAIGAALGAANYTPGVVQPLNIRMSISVLMCIVPAVCMIIAFVVFACKYKLNESTMKVVINTMTARREGKISSDEVLDENGKIVDGVDDVLKVKNN